MSWPHSPPSAAPEPVARTLAPLPEGSIPTARPRKALLPLALSNNLPPTGLLQGWVVSRGSWDEERMGKFFQAPCPAQPTSLVWGQTGLGLPCGLDITGTCVPRRLQFWTLEFESQSFLYRQVRRMTAILVAVGLGALTPTQVKVILESRDPLGRHQTRVAPAHGLFLKSVLYRDLEDLAARNPASAQQESPALLGDFRPETSSAKAGGPE